MKEEKEIRFKVITNKEKIKNKMKEVDDSPRVFEIVDTYFDDEDYNLVRSFRGYRCREVFSLESETRRTIYCYKEIKNEKVYEREYQKKTDFYGDVCSYSNHLVIRKKRTIWQKEDTEFVLDETCDLGNYFEVECRESDPSQVIESLDLPETWIKEEERGMTEIWLDKNITNNQG